MHSMRLLRAGRLCSHSAIRARFRLLDLCAAPARRCRAAAASAAEAVDTETTYSQAPFKAAIDFKAIVENLDAVEVNVKNRFSRADPRRVADLYAKFSKLSRETDQMRQERNDNAKAMKVTHDRCSMQVHVSCPLSNNRPFCLLYTTMSACSSAPVRQL
jgi:Seryl-tRNA synthetase N-terminal domain